MAVGALLGRFAGSAKALGSGAMEFGSQAAGSLGSLAKALSPVAKDSTAAAKSLGGLTSQLSKMMLSVPQATGMIGGLIQSVMKSFMDPLENMKALAAPLAELVSLANPAVVKQFTLAMNDAMAVFGQIATPILKGMTLWTRQFGDAWAKMVPVLEPLTNTLGQLFADLGYLGARVLEAWSPLIQLMVDVMVPVIRETAKAFAFMQGFLVEVIKTVMGLLGLNADRRDEKRNSTGAAVRNASVTSVEGFAKDLFTMNAKNLFGGEKTNDPVKVQTDILNAIKEGQEVFKNIKEGVEDIFAFLRDAYSKFVETKNSVMDIGGKVGGALAKTTVGGVASNGIAGIGAGSAVGSLIGLLGRAILK